MDSNVPEPPIFPRAPDSCAATAEVGGPAARTRKGEKGSRGRAATERGCAPGADGEALFLTRGPVVRDAFVMRLER
jgi:hypothetical protein